MIARPQPKPGILDIAAYVPGKSGAKGEKVWKLSSNESPLGPSPRALEAFHAASASLALYPDGSAEALRQAIAQRYGLNPDNIVCGAGSDELLQLLAHTYLGAGDEAIYSQFGFLVYPIVIAANGATARVAAERDHRTDVDAILALANAKTRIVFLANPNNPTGTYIPFDEVKRLHRGLPAGCLLVLDAAYAEYVRANDYEAGIELVSSAQNVVMTRTFSKIHGLAALRLGWMYAPDHVVDAVNRIRGPFNVSAPAIAAGAAAIRDEAHVAAAAAHNDLWLERMGDALRGLGLGVTPSAGNFLLVHLGEGRARAADAHLLARGIVLRRMEAYGLLGALRLTIGAEEANLAVIAALKEFRGLMFERVALIGLGLIGSSLAHVMRRDKLARHIAGHAKSAATLTRAAELDLADSYHAKAADAVAGADLVILCIPIGAYGAMAEEIAPALSQGAILTDVGSVKAAVVRDVLPHVPEGVHFIPGHPIAGTEKSGPDAGFPELFVNKWCVLTPLAGADAAAVAKLEDFWKACGSHVERMNPEHHDLVLAITSHLPHLIAYNIVATAADLEEVTNSEVIKFSAGGFRDFTRIAASDPTMWRDIFLNNKAAVLETLGRFSEDLALLQRAIRWDDGETLFDLFTRSREIRRGIVAAGQDTAAPDFGRGAAKK